MQGSHSRHNYASQSCDKVLREEWLSSLRNHLRFFWHATDRVCQTAVMTPSILPIPSLHRLQQLPRVKPNSILKNHLHFLDIFDMRRWVTLNHSKIRILSHSN